MGPSIDAARADARRRRARLLRRRLSRVLAALLILLLTFSAAPARTRSGVRVMRPERSVCLGDTFTAGVRWRPRFRKPRWYRVRVQSPGRTETFTRVGRAPRGRWRTWDVRAQKLGWYKVIYRWHRNIRSYLVRTVECGEPEGLANNLADGAVLFELPGVAPGLSASSCITVSYDRETPLEVRLYGVTGGTGLDPYLRLRVTRGSMQGGVSTSSTCSGFEADTAAHAGLGPGVVYDGTVEGWPDGYEEGLVDPDRWLAGDRQTYRFTVWLPASTGNEAQGLTASQTFVWEGRA